MVTATDLARFAEQRKSDIAYTLAAAQEIRLRRLIAERVDNISDELQGDLSYSENRLARRLRAEAA